MLKIMDEKKSQPDEVDIPTNDKSVNEINDTSSQQEPNGQSDIHESRAEKLARSLLPL